ncbi:SAM-dependent methyltransferase [Nocardia grenadensis]
MAQAAHDAFSERVGDRTPEQFWDDLYGAARQRPEVWGARPGPVLAEVAAELVPGTALDLACGSGGDTLWLARRGWQVKAVDISAVAVERVAEVARDAGLGHLVTTERHDLEHTFPAGSFDLVSAQYFHTPFVFPRAKVLATAAEAVTPGGRLLVVDHGSIAPWSWNQDHDAYHHPAPEEVYAELGLPDAVWSVERAEKAERRATGPDGQTAAVIDNILLIRRARD